MSYKCACCNALQANDDVTIMFRADDDLRVVNICYECDEFALLKAVRHARGVDGGAR